MVFLGAHPFDYRYWWNALVQQSCDSGSTRGFANLTRLLQPSSGGIMWRTRKVDVKEDLDLRPQTVSITSLDLSEVERHFYKQQHQECSLSSSLIIVLSLQNNNEKQTTLFVTYQEDSLIVSPHIG